MTTLILVLIIISCCINGALLFKLKWAAEDNQNLIDDLQSWVLSWNETAKQSGLRYDYAKRWKALAKAQYSEVTSLTNRVKYLHKEVSYLLEAYQNEQGELNKAYLKIESLEKEAPPTDWEEHKMPVIFRDAIDIYKYSGGATDCTRCKKAWYPGVLTIGKCKKVSKKKSKKR